MGIDAMSMAQASIQMNQAKLQQDVQVSVMKLAINQQTQSTQQLMQVLSSANIPDPQGRGQMLDIFV